MSVDLSQFLGMPIYQLTLEPYIMSMRKNPKMDWLGGRWYLTFRENGIAFVAEVDGRVEAIQLFSEGFQQYQQFSGELPISLCFNESRRSVRQRLGSRRLQVIPSNHNKGDREQVDRQRQNGPIPSIGQDRAGYHEQKVRNQQKRPHPLGDRNGDRVTGTRKLNESEQQNC